MGTRSLTIVQDEERHDLVTMYRQWDGYPSGHGTELVKFLKTLQLCNGLGGTPPRGKTWANGSGCLAAQLVAHFKEKPGDIYLHPAGTRDCGEEWTYYVQVNDQSLTLNLKVYAGAVAFFGMPGTKEQDMPCLFSGPVNQFKAAQIESLRHSMSIEPTALQD